MSDWFTVTACPREIGRAGFPLFFPEPSFALRSGTNSYPHLPSWKQPVQAVYLRSQFLFRFSRLICVCHDSQKARGAELVPSNQRFGSIFIASSDWSHTYDSAFFSKIQPDKPPLDFFPWFLLEISRQPRATVDHELRPSAPRWLRVRPFMNRDPMTVLVTYRTLPHLHTHT